MILREFYVDGFGVHRDLRHAPGPGLNLVVGPNEAGKTTLHDFVRCMLFGFGRGGAGAHPPLRGGSFGGWLELEGPRGKVRIERKGTGRRDLRVLLPGGAVGSQADLDDLFRRMDGQLYRNVFAFGLDELADFSKLTGPEMELRLFDSSLSGAGRSASALKARLDELRAAELGPRSGRVRELAREIARLESELKEARARARGHRALVQEELRLARQIEETEGFREAASRRVARHEDLLALWETELRRKEAEEALAQLSPPPDAPLEPDLLARFDAAAEGLARLRADEAERDAELGRIAAERGGLARDPRIERVSKDPACAAIRREEGAQAARRERLAEVRAAVDDKRSLLQGLGASSAPDRGPALAELKAAKADRDQAMRRLESLRDQRLAAGERRGGSKGLPLLAAIGAALFLAGAGSALALGEAGVAAVAGGAALAFAGLALAARSRAAAGSGQGRLGDLDGAIAEAEASIRALDGAIAAHALAAGIEGEPTAGAIETAIDALQQERSRKGRAADLEEALARDLAEEARLAAAVADFEPRAGALLEAAGLEGGEAALGRLWDAIEEDRGKAERLRLLDERERALREAAAKAGRERERLEADCAGILRRAGAADREALARTIASEARRAELERSLGEAQRAIDARLGAGEAAEEARRQLATGDVAEWTETRDRGREDLETLRKRIAELNQAFALQRKARQELEESADVPRLAAELEATRTQLADAARRWRRATILDELLRAALEEMRRERQPAVLRYAGQAFSRVTAGRYEKVEQTVDATGIEVVAAGSGVRVPASALSRGTREQLYVCIRLGLAAAFAEAGTRLPLLLDDVFVNFDPERAAATAAVVADFAREHQVLLFTCHPHTVDHVRAEAPDAALLELAA
ncbi:MAG TPA: AAA family ATPase [Vulgatibacter sp.]|nr:AAA family ATPase [Vulgatibacter sp.]